jgi:kynureninase
MTGRKHGVMVGFDLAHATGNVPLRLHDWDVDFAVSSFHITFRVRIFFLVCVITSPLVTSSDLHSAPRNVSLQVFCTYKYLNGGPGSPGGAYIHERHSSNVSLRRLAGWFGNDPNTRFKMDKDFVPVAHADGWQLSNVPIMGLAALWASVELFDSVPFDQLRQKSLALSSYVMDLLEAHRDDKAFEVLTPRDAKYRGCQVSVRILGDSDRIHVVHKRITDLVSFFCFFYCKFSLFFSLFF